MGSYLKEFRKHLRIYFLFAKNSIMQQLEYRTNFFVEVIVESLWLISKLVYVFIINRANTEVPGITPDETMLFVGTFMLMTAIYTGVFMRNFYAIPGLIHRGDLDLLITKPVSLQFIVSMKGANVALPIPNIIGGLTLVILGWHNLGITASLAHIFSYVGLMLWSGFLTYSIFLFPQILTFWIVKTGAIVELTDRMWDFNRMPMSIYSLWMQRLFTFLLPVFFVTNYPVMAIVESMTTLEKVWAGVAPLIFFVLVRLFWNVSVKRYSSAGG